MLGKFKKEIVKGEVNFYLKISNLLVYLVIVLHLKKIALRKSSMFKFLQQTYLLLKEGIKKYL